jgi:hypothetical protein
MPFHNSFIKHVSPEDQWHGHHPHPHGCDIPEPPPSPIIEIDPVPTENSNFAVKSGGVWQALKDISDAWPLVTGDLSTLYTVFKGNLVGAINEVWTDVQAITNVRSYELLTAAPLQMAFGQFILAGDTRNDYQVLMNGTSAVGTLMSDGTAYTLPVGTTDIRVTHAGRLVYSWQRAAQEPIDYVTQVFNKPQINNIELTGNISLSSLGAASLTDIADFYTKPPTGIPLNDLSSLVWDQLVPTTGSAGQVLMRDSGGGLSWTNMTGISSVVTADSPSVRMMGDGAGSATPLQAFVKLSASAGNILETRADGLYGSISGVVSFNETQSPTAAQLSTAYYNLQLGDPNVDFYQKYVDGKASGSA